MQLLAEPKIYSYSYVFFWPNAPRFDCTNVHEKAYTLGIEF